MSAISPLPLCYLPPVIWFRQALQQDLLVLDVNEHFIKQTWRNRIQIVGANGIQNLIIPVVHDRNARAIGKIRIEYKDDWRRQHRHAIQSAYGNTPFFEYYADSLFSFYQGNRFELLSDINLELLNWSLKMLKSSIKVSKTEDFVPYSELDFRQMISPKSNWPLQQQYKRYIQPFEHKFGFVPNCSIIDTLFCCGPEAIKSIS